MKKKWKLSGGLVAVALVSLIGIVSPSPASGQEAEAAPAEGTIVTSNRFRLDLEKKEGVFSGDVRVVDTEFEITAEELVAYFDDKNEVERLVARGKVTIVQGADRTATCREAEYLVSENSLRLTGDPVVSQSGNQVTGTVIKIFPEGDRMEVDGRSKVQFFLD